MSGGKQSANYVNSWPWEWGEAMGPRHPGLHPLKKLDAAPECVGYCLHRSHRVRVCLPRGIVFFPGAGLTRIDAPLLTVGVVAMGWVQRSGQLRLRHRRGGGVDRRLCVGVRVVGGAVDGDGSLRMADTRDQTNEKDICASTWMRWGVQAG